MKKISLYFLLFVLFIFSVTPAVAEDWTQDAHDPQRTGYTSEDPLTPWSLAWMFNGPDSTGKVSCPNNDPTKGHCFDGPREGRSITGGAYVFLPAGSWGFYALKKTDGTVAWRSTATTFNATAAYSSGFVYAAGSNGTVYKFNADTGAVAGSFASGNPINKSLLLVGNFVYAVSDTSTLYKIQTSNMTLSWSYGASGNPVIGTPPAYAATKDLIIFATNDLFVHAVNNSNGSQKWRVKPTTNTPSGVIQFSSGHPVIAEQHGIVFVRLNIGIEALLNTGTWPTTNAAIRSKLVAAPQWKNLFPLDLNTGAEKFVPAVGPGGTEDLINNSPQLRMQAMPVVKVLPNGKEVVYVHWRNAQVSTARNSDERWNGNVGEMVLDDTTISGLAAGDLRFIQGEDATYWHIIDEQTPLTIANNSIFHSHWSGVVGQKILDRSDSKGLTLSSPITTQHLPPIVRATFCVCSNDPFNASTHYSSSCALAYDHGGQQCSGRWFGSGGFYVYKGILDPPTPTRNAYSDGIRPRYTYVADKLLVVQGNGGDLFVLKHSGVSASPLPSGSSSPAVSPSPSPLPGDTDNNGVVNTLDLKIVLLNWQNAMTGTIDQHVDGKINMLDAGKVIKALLGA